jgi:hypothetical protein
MPYLLMHRALISYIFLECFFPAPDLGKSSGEINAMQMRGTKTTIEHLEVVLRQDWVGLFEPKLSYICLTGVFGGKSRK